MCARIRAQLTSDRRKVALARPKLEDGVESGQGVVFKGSTQVTELGQPRHTRRGPRPEKGASGAKSKY